MTAARVTRRTALAAAAVAATAAGAFAQRGLAPRIRDVGTAPAGLPDTVMLGSPGARVTVIEYLSLTCSHCARFHRDVLPDLKARYVEPGHARFVFREFPLDTLAAAAALLVRCAPPPRSLAVMTALLERQSDWASGVGAEIKLYTIAGEAGGFTAATFDACLRETAVLTRIEAAQAHAAETFGVDGTPAFFVGGDRLTGHAFSDVAHAIENALRRAG